jgi:hypothetical protein
MAFRGYAVWLCALLALPMGLIGCGGPPTMSGSRAGEGAQTGAAVGAVGGVLVGLIGGERRLGEAALAGAAVGAAAGATAGAVSGAAEDAEIKEEIGEKNFEGLMYLVNCQHGFALTAAEEEQKQAEDPRYRLAALWLEVLITGDLGDDERLKDLFEILVEEDSDVKTVEEARSQMKRALMEVRDYRVEMGKPRRCS